MKLCLRGFALLQCELTEKEEIFMLDGAGGVINFLCVRCGAVDYLFVREICAKVHTSSCSLYSHHRQVLSS